MKLIRWLFSSGFYLAIIFVWGMGGAVLSEFHVLDAFADAKSYEPLDPVKLWSGETGETYTVSDTNHFIGTSRFPERIHACQGHVDTHATREALAGRSGRWIYTDYGDAWVIGSYRPADVDGSRVCVTAERDLVEFLANLIGPAIYWILPTLLIWAIHAVFRKGSR